MSSLVLVCLQHHSLPCPRHCPKTSPSSSSSSLPSYHVTRSPLICFGSPTPVLYPPSPSTDPSTHLSLSAPVFVFLTWTYVGTIILFLHTCCRDYLIFLYTCFPGFLLKFMAYMCFLVVVSLCATRLGTLSLPYVPTCPSFLLEYVFSSSFSSFAYVSTGFGFLFPVDKFPRGRVHFPLHKFTSVSLEFLFMLVSAGLMVFPLGAPFGPWCCFFVVFLVVFLFYTLFYGLDAVCLVSGFVRYFLSLFFFFSFLSSCVVSYPLFVLYFCFYFIFCLPCLFFSVCC